MQFYNGFNYTTYKGYTIYRLSQDGEWQYYAQDNDKFSQPKTRLYNDINKLKWDIDHYRIILK